MLSIVRPATDNVAGTADWQNWCPEGLCCVLSNVLPGKWHFPRTFHWLPTWPLLSVCSENELPRHSLIELVNRDTGNVYDDKCEAPAVVYRGCRVIDWGDMPHFIQYKPQWVRER